VPWFELPVTHALSFLDGGPVTEHFVGALVAMIGFCYGIDLVPEGWGHLHRVSVSTERIQDFHMTTEATIRVMERFVTFWREHPEARSHIFGILRWHPISATYEHGHEMFAAQYMVLDACWHLHMLLHADAAAPQRVSHANRVRRLIDAYGMTAPPQWNIEGRSNLAFIRNQLFHEALWGGEPIGVGVGPPEPNTSPEWDLLWFNSRLIFALLGERNNYTESAPAGVTFLFA
jgi:hypothetical protein